MTQNLPNPFNDGLASSSSLANDGLYSSQPPGSEGESGLLPNTLVIEARDMHQSAEEEDLQEDSQQLGTQGNESGAKKYKETIDINASNSMISNSIMEKIGQDIQEAPNP